MTVFLQFIANNANIVYGLIALVALFYLRRAIITRRERRSAIFPLEKEVARGRVNQIFGIAVLLLALIGITWAASNLLLPRLKQVEGVSTSTPDILVLINTPTTTPPPPTATPTITPTARPRPTRIPPTIAPTATPAFQAPNCPNPGAAIASPGNGQVVEGLLPVTGSASIQNFQFYKLEFASVGNRNQWNWFAGSERPVVGGTLGSLNASGLPGGEYLLRLVVVDNTGNYPEPCVVRIVVP